MKTKEITIAGKTATLAYCYATEIAFKALSGQDINDFMPEVAAALDAERLPDTKKTIYIVLAGIIAYYESRGEDAPIKDTDLMNEATPVELGAALGTVLSLRSQFYTLPAGEPEEKGKGKKGKN